MTKLELLKKSSRNANRFMKPNLEEDANTRWVNKEVKESITLYDGTTLKNVSYKEGLKCSISSEVYLTDEKSLKVEGNTFAEGISPRPTLGISIELHDLDLSKYNRLSFDIMPVATGYQNFYYHISILNNGKYHTNAPSLTPNKWNKVVWEIDKYDRTKVSSITITAFMMGCPPEGLPEFVHYIDNVKAEVVDVDYDLGWDLENRVAFSHVGYYPNQQKVALAKDTTETTFMIYNMNDELEYSAKIEKVNNKLGNFAVLDFSDFNKLGEYYLTVGNIKTKSFIIDKNPYDSSIWKSMNFLRLLRCGEDIEGVHSACHLNCRTMHPNGSSVPNFGGWHDAGDVSQFEICTAEMTHAILDLAETKKDKDLDLYERLLQEARVGANWLLRTRFGDGMRAMAVLYNVWRDNVLSPDNKSVYANVAENGPFENFTSSAALAKASVMFDDDPVFADWCKRSAIGDFEAAKLGYENSIYTKRWGPNIDSQVAGHGIIAAVELYKATQNEDYLKVAKSYAKIVLSCQETEGIGKDKIKGFFYEDPLHKYILTYEHRGHEQSPIHGLAMLLEILPNDEETSSWINGLKLYKEYVMSTITDTKPYGLVPGHIYILDKINMNRFTVPPTHGTIEEAYINLQLQAKQGRKVSDNAYIRTFPISIQRRGFHATLLSKTKAVSIIAKVLKDDELKQIAIDQLEWILGKNPFASSTMYGEGYNYHPLYVAFSPQMVGALPVGIMTYGEADLPYWPMMTQAVYKEIWGHTTGKYLWVLADIE